MSERLEVLAEIQKLRGAQESLIEYAQLVSPGYLTPPHILQTADAAERIARGELKRLMVLMPPRHGKSDLLSQKLPTWILGRNPTLQIVNAGYAQEIALEHSRKARALFEGDEFSRIFPGVCAGPETAAQRVMDRQATGEWTTAQGGRYYAVGVGGGLTGRGMNLGIIDDPVKNREEADSLIIRERTWEWYLSTFYTRLEPGGAIILVMTPWHEDDLAGRLIRQMESGKGEQWEIIRYPAIAHEGTDHEEALWPERYPLEVLHQKRDMLSARGDTKEWQSLYQCKPSAGTTFNALWIQDTIDTHRVHERPHMNLLAVALDPATTSKASSDEAGIIAGGIGPDGHIYVLEDVSLRAPPLEWAKAAIACHHRNQGDGIVYESNQGGDMVALTLATVDPRVPSHPVHASRGKRTRAEPVAALYAQGFVHHVGPFPQLEAQMTSWIPGEPSPDRMDALVWLVTYLIEWLAHKEETVYFDAVEELGGIDHTGIVR